MIKKKNKIVYVIISLILYQTFLYLITKTSPFKPHYIKIGLDNSIPFIPSFIYFYVSWYAMLFLIPYKIYKNDIEVFYKYILSLAITITVLALIYLFYPTIVVRPDIISTNITLSLLKFIYFIDTPALNCLPSMHCNVCFLFIFYIINSKNINKKSKIIICIWSLIVIISTLFVKQHVILDIISAFIVSFITFIIVNNTNWWKKYVIEEN